MARARLLLLFGLASTAVLLGCESKELSVFNRIAPTYHEDVAPVLARHCWCCHAEQGAPPSFSTYEAVRDRFDDLWAAIDEGRMPPGGVQPGCGVDAAGLRLDAAELALLDAWDRGGRHEGDRAASAPTPPPCARLESVTTERLTPPHRVRAVPVETRCFPIDLHEDDRPLFLTGYRIDLGHPVVRSATLHPGPSLEEVREGPSFECAPDTPEPFYAASFPGTGDVVFPSGSGVPILRDRHVVLRVRYDRRLAPDAIEPLDVQTRIELSLASRVSREATWSVFGAHELALPPGEENAEHEVIAVASSPVRVAGAGGLLFDHGTGFSIDRPDTGECVLEVDRFDPRQPRIVWRASPISIRRGELLRIRCRYDTRGATEVIGAGSPPDGEQCLAALYTLF